MIRAEPSIVLTGGTGFLGAFLMAGLLERGYHVTVLGRSSKGMKLSDRLSGLVRWFSIPDPGERLVGFEADLSQKQFGLDHETYRRQLYTDIRKLVWLLSSTHYTIP